jgi:aminoglycoside phosphotransferase (APT) family kinase protein
MTNELRDRLCPMLDSARRQLVAKWCDWTDEILAAPGTAALVHGDFHGFNVIIDDNESVCVALDVETSSYGDFHYDFRYLPAQEATVELFVRCADEYERLTTRPVELPRVMAWHVRTVLGDALWRTEARRRTPRGRHERGLGRRARGTVRRTRTCSVGPVLRVSKEPRYYRNLFPVIAC